MGMGCDHDIARWAETPVLCRFGAEADALEVWLHADFAGHYDQALDDPVPLELVRLAMGFSGHAQ